MTSHDPQRLGSGSYAPRVRTRESLGRGMAALGIVVALAMLLLAGG